MSKGRKRKDPAGENAEAYKHETETRKNAVALGPSSYNTSRPNPIEDKGKVGSIYRRIREILESARSSAFKITVCDLEERTNCEGAYTS